MQLSTLENLSKENIIFHEPKEYQLKKSNIKYREIQYREIQISILLLLW